MSRTFVIGARYAGPPRSGNGGYSCGAVARAFSGSPFGLAVPGAVEVKLEAPPPLETELRVTEVDGGVDVHHDAQRIATGRSAVVDLVPPDAVDFDAASKASEGYAWRNEHPIPSCFVCSPKRDDGLRIFPGTVAGRDVAAAPWRPDASVVDGDGLATLEVVWAALDCPSYFGIHAKHGRSGKAESCAAFGSADMPKALLGRLAARIDARPTLGEPCVLVGWCTELDGRKSHVGSALYSEERGLLAIARGTWVTLK